MPEGGARFEELRHTPCVRYKRMFDPVFYEALRALEPLAADGTGGQPVSLSDALGALAVVRGGLDALEAGLLAGLEPGVAVDALVAGGKTSARQARKVAARADTLAAAPQLSAGLAAGTVTAE